MYDITAALYLVSSVFTLALKKKKAVQRKCIVTLTLDFNFNIRISVVLNTVVIFQMIRVCKLHYMFKVKLRKSKNNLIAQNG